MRETSKSRSAPVSAHSHSEGRRNDLISELPDHLLHQILFKLRTKDSVKTSVLSRRWRYVWRHVPGLDLNYTDFKYSSLKGFVSRFLDFDEKSLIQNLKLSFDSTKYEIRGSYFKNWINSVVTRGLQHLVVDASSVSCLYSEKYLPSEIPGSICRCETLVHLKLMWIHMQNFENVCLPRLESLFLRRVWFPSDAALEKLISSSQVLRVLKIEGVRNVEVLRVRSQTLLSLCVWKRLSKIDGVVIDAPLLKSMTLITDQFINLTLSSLCSPTKMDIDFFEFYPIYSLSTEDFRNFFAAASKVTDLTLPDYVLEAIYTQWGHVPLPVFSNLTCLKVCFSPSNSDLLLRFLAHCPNLKSLDLEIFGSVDGFDFHRSPVPMCLLTSLEVVEIEWGIEKYPLETTLVLYFLRNAANLRKLYLDLPRGTVEEKYQVVSQILTFPRRSSACQVLAYSS